MVTEDEVWQTIGIIYEFEHIHMKRSAFYTTLAIGIFDF